METSKPPEPVNTGKKEYTQLVRNLKLLLTLASGVRHTKKELAERYGVTERTITRDLDNLADAGFAVENENGYFRVDKPDSPFRELHDLLFFTEEEAGIMRRAIHSIDENTLLKQNLVDKLYALYNFGKVAETIVRREHSKNVTNLMAAIRNKKQVILKAYHSAHGNSVENRLVEPFGFTTGFIAIWAFDVVSRTNKVFKTARIKEVVITDHSWTGEPLHRSEDMDVFRISGSRKTDVRLRLSLMAYNLLTEEYPLAEKYTSPLPGNRWLFDGWVCGFQGVGRYVLGLAGEVEIIEPEKLKVYVQKKIKNLTK